MGSDSDSLACLPLINNHLRAVQTKSEVSLYQRPWEQRSYNSDIVDRLRTMTGAAILESALTKHYFSGPTLLEIARAHPETQVRYWLMACAYYLIYNQNPSSQQKAVVGFLKAIEQAYFTHNSEIAGFSSRDDWRHAMILMLRAYQQASRHDLVIQVCNLFDKKLLEFNEAGKRVKRSALHRSQPLWRHYTRSIARIDPDQLRSLYRHKTLTKWQQRIVKIALEQREAPAGR